ncbi:hypothetical protein Goarm_018701 [Gossypium armourianum]|uniref:RNase H type-1 domain-containing protein n=1 Tax=Gossypium armourianum TaxID=34283 RepID=A0A7J9IIB5_9ROSI|nr:hypothetical protein [Gossypium armourianum]
MPLLVAEITVTTRNLLVFVRKIVRIEGGWGIGFSNTALLAKQWSQSTFGNLEKHLGNKGASVVGEPYPINSPRVYDVNMIANLIVEQDWAWKENLHGLSDKLQWCPENSGGYTVRKRYRLLLRGFPEVEDDLYRDIDETVVWRPLPNPWVRVDFNYRFHRDLEALSSGIIIRDNNGLTIGAMCLWNRNIPTVEVTKALVAIQAIKFAQEMEF